MRRTTTLSSLIRLATFFVSSVIAITPVHADKESGGVAPEGELTFSAPPQGSYANESAIYQPLVEYLSRVTGKKITYQYSDNWLAYSKSMTRGDYDLVFDDPALNGWRQERLKHTPLVKLADDFVFVVVVPIENSKIQNVKQLAGRTVCAQAPPHVGTLTLISQFDNPVRLPLIIEVPGPEQAFAHMLEGKCDSSLMPLKNLQQLDRAIGKQTRIIYQHRAMPNQALSASPRVSSELRTKIRQALLSEEGVRATAKLRTAFAGNHFIAASRDEYAGLGLLLKDSLYYE